ncbi:ABC-type transporter, integral membrane subunit [Rhodothermus marinus SG0.5JP17-172]|uniref:metal ABC transporter permease n=1 Tax=Rhodothermus marinus TaxID=29549 RepID=UPI000223D664|nr:metal ABC transporter permease [Rhodothermus marinus]AEN73246.1 ABC-type transporter, integral membrane subunit [Rhodothermus marinus SG0.5JP17-172]MBO2491460.1 metal ABC transporter permease [Rhodothermus marinus]
MSPALEILLVAMLTAAACALPGAFLVLRRLSLVSDAISHAVLPGIVLGFFLTENLQHPLLLVLAGASGLLTVYLIELLEKTGRLREDTAIGLVFPALFSVGVLLIARFAGQVHLDTDAVLLGELAFVPFDRLIWRGIDLGPRALWTMAGLLLINALLIRLLYKELVLTTFDAATAAVLGFRPVLLHYLLMGLVAVTVVAAFHAVGAILVIALMIGPPAAALLLARRMPTYLLGSLLFGVLSAVPGYGMARLLDVSIAGSMATMVGVLFCLVWLLAPETGLLARWRRHRRQQRDFALDLLLFHLLHHEHRPEATAERHRATLPLHLNWTDEKFARILEEGQRRGWLRLEGRMVRLTEAGRRHAQKRMETLTPAPHTT